MPRNVMRKPVDEGGWAQMMLYCRTKRVAEDAAKAKGHDKA